MEKGTRVEQIAEAPRRLHEAGIEVGFFLQFGYPGETREDIELTLQMVRDCRPDDIGVSVSYPLPGTPFYERVKAQLGEKQNWVDSNDLAMMYRATYAPEFYRALHALVHAEFRAREALGACARRVARPRRRGLRTASRASCARQLHASGAWRADTARAAAGRSPATLPSTPRAAGRPCVRADQRGDASRRSPTATARAARRGRRTDVRPAAAGLLSDQPLQQPLRVVRLVEVAAAPTT